MAKDKKRKSKFRGAVSRNAEKQNRGAQYGYLKLPKGINMFKEEPKTRVQLDIMPYKVTSNYHPDRDDEYGIAVPGTLWYKRPYWIHRSVGSDSQSVVCPSSIGQKCPICEYRAKMLKEGAKWDDDSVRALKPSMRNLYVVIPKENKNYEEKPHIWDISQNNFQKMLNEEVQENEEYETFPDLEEGYTLRIRFAESSFGTNKFAEASRIDFMERKKPYDESILEKIPSLDDILEVLSYQAIEAMFFGGMTADELDDEDEEEDEEEESRPARNRRQGREEDEEDDDDEDEEVEDDDDGEEETETGEDDEDEDEDDEPSPPPRKRKAPESKGTKGKDKKDSKDSKEKSKNKCPYGHKFGVDIDNEDECEDCKVWDECMAASEE